MNWSRKATIFWPVLAVLVLTDCATKRLAVLELSPTSMPRDVVGDVVRFSLAYNPGAAMSIYLGPWSRIIFTAVALGAVGVLAALYRRTAAADAGRALALALVIGGAVGNLIDRLRSPLGVVDFIDVGVGSSRFWTFNIADVGVTCGAIALGWVLLRQEDEQTAPSPRI
ncbi:MAG: signal peptidase II [Gemmatimonadota bacterium]